MHAFFSKYKTLLKQLAPGNEYTNILPGISCANRKSFTKCCFILGRKIEFPQSSLFLVLDQR